MSTPPASAAAREGPPPPVAACFQRNPANKRFVFLFNNNPIYEWEQTLEEVILYIAAPPGVATADLRCEITPSQLRVGLKTAKQWFINEDTFAKVDVEESTWTMEEGTIVIYLQKANKALLWNAALTGQAVELDPAQQEAVKQDLMLERFGNEHPGMDFRDANFNGSVPDPRSYMGGIKYT